MNRVPLLVLALVACDPDTIDNPDDTDTDVVTDGCTQAAAFPTVSPAPENDRYADPSVSAACSDDTLVVEANGIPGFEFVQVTPADLQAQDWRWEIPRYPEVAAQTTEIPLLGTAAFGVDGLPIYGPNEGDFPDPYGDPVYNEVIDFCLGHTAQRGDYHYHALLQACVLLTAEDDGASPILGYALDGFPIYGPRGCLDADCAEVVTFESGWQQTGDPETYAWDAHTYVASTDETTLDQCNGRVGPDGTYRYHATSTFPYVLGCYRGTPSDDAGQ